MGSGRFIPPQFGNRVENSLAHAFGIAEDLIIPETQNAIAVGMEPPRPLLIAAGHACVLPAIDLDDKRRIKTREVGDIRAEHCLPAKLGPIETTTTEDLPGRIFGACGRIAHSRGPST